jgi:predicted nucleotidyltransferase
MQTRVNHITHVLTLHMDVLREAYYVKAIGVFGSVARGEEATASDVDILVEFSRPVGFFTFLELEEYLSRVLGRRVDLVTKNALKPAIKEAVLQGVVYV